MTSTITIQQTTDALNASNDVHDYISNGVTYIHRRILLGDTFGFLKIRHEKVPDVVVDNARIRNIDDM